MAEAVCRALRDGGLEGEHAPALTIKDTIASPFGPEVFAHVLTQLSSFILAGKSQSRGLVIVAFSRSPSFYVDLLKRKGIDAASTAKWYRILDCYSDPLGWKDQSLDVSVESSSTVTLCKDVRDLDKLFSSIIELGRGLIGPTKGRFSVAIDSVNEMLRHTPGSSVAGLLSNLRSNESVSSIFWSINAELHEARVIAALEYMSTMTASLEQLYNRFAKEQPQDSRNVSFLQQNFGKGKLNVRMKRRNGRVRLMSEDFQAEQSGINFSSALPGDGIAAIQGLVPKVQFNLQLSEKEQIDKASVVLPFEHQGNGKPIEIYDGRKSLPESKNEATLASTGKSERNEGAGKGEIIYFRDSDDEMLDSDEDPDDDLDI